MSEQVWRFCVEVPVRAGEEVCDRIYDAISDAVHDAEPADRDGWDAFVYGFQTDVADEHELADFALILGVEP